MHPVEDQAAPGVHRAVQVIITTIIIITMADPEDTNAKKDISDGTFV